MDWRVFHFPLTVGMLGLHMSYLETIQNAHHELSLDRDFVLPFSLVLALASGWLSNECTMPMRNPSNGWWWCGPR
jgi:hypothetical protein